ncbi:hypothetical protein BLNAU_19601 [Blattamonas nauphoetae]|uniref:B30.2/SPRY domain-containing protein n=1 Tax=Blattamonas nauphoetae TaxID=2049346 RepID=A0ABQ9X1A8_9EUKA|nr:hypothetical protein BLNAU_19601 [Blattamonas nauphoetae]
MSIESMLKELTRSGSDISVIVNTRFWNTIPLLIRKWDGKEEEAMCSLLDELSRILTLTSDSEVPLANKRLLHSSLSALSQKPTLPTKIRIRVEKCIPTLNSITDGTFMLVETDEFRIMEEQKKELETRSSEITQQKLELDTQITDLQHFLEEEKTIVEELKSEIDQLTLQLADLPIWVGTESLRCFNGAAHRLTPTTITQINKISVGTKDWRTAFTFPIDDGEWELKINAFETILKNVMLGFVKHPLPQTASQSQCGSWLNGIGGDFNLWSGGMWKSKEFHPAGTNKRCDRVGQTAAIRVNMRTREARLFVDDEEQPGIFTDIPSPLCLGITTGFTESDHQSVKVLWLKQLRRNDELHGSVLKENTTLQLLIDKLKLYTPKNQIWIGTESLKTLDRTAHSFTPTTLTQIIKLEKTNEWRTSFTHPINKGEWELKIKACENTFLNVMLGFVRHPIPENGTRLHCGQHIGGIGGDFNLWDGSMWKGGEFKPAGTNRKCDRVGQTAAIRVNMRRREAKLFVDDEEQPGIFTDIPSPLCLGISTGFRVENLSVEVLWLKRNRS